MEHIHAALFLQMIRSGAETLRKNVDHVNALNVFPVPDGDTGTNMSLTITSGLKEMEKSEAESVGQMAEALSKGLLMGARGNSGVILSQLFRGFAKALAGKETMNARQFADAFYQGVETAYKAVIKPVEGTVLTVAREAADAGMKIAWSVKNPVEIMETIHKHAVKTLERTPEMLSVLEEVNVVDAGGQGLVLIYEGMLSALKGEEGETVTPVVDIDKLIEETHQSAQSQIDPDQIEKGYCTEFMIERGTERRTVRAFDEQSFRKELAQYGDSLLVVADDQWVKVHIHTEMPGDALNYAIQFGDLHRIKIENMREQYKQVTKTKKPTAEQEEKTIKKPYGILAIATGEGITNIFHSLGVDQVLQGGQTMNPSTEEIVEAIRSIEAEHIFVFPNNKNIILTAKQAAKFVNTPITVFETKTILQGLAALLAYEENRDLEDNIKRMSEQFTQVRTGEVTYAVRDTEINGLPIKQGDFMGLIDGEIHAHGKELFEVAGGLIDDLVDEETDVVTLIVGKEMSQQEVNQWVDGLREKYQDQEFEVHDGGQPLYYLLIGVE